MFPYEAILGGITGIVGSVTTGLMNNKMKKMDIEQSKLDNDHELMIVDLESKAMVLEKDAEIQVISTEYDGKEGLIDADAYKETQKNLNKDDSKIYTTIENMMKYDGVFGMVSKFVGMILLTLLSITEVARKAIRPGLTIFYTITSSYICFTCFVILNERGDAISSEKLYIILDQCVSAIIYLTITIVVYWFSDRSAGKFIQDQLSKKDK